jgi:hypothetical protein
MLFLIRQILHFGSKTTQIKTLGLYYSSFDKDFRPPKKEKKISYIINSLVHGRKNVSEKNIKVSNKKIMKKINKN